MKLSKWSKRSLLFILSAMMACAAAGCDSGTGGSSTASTSSNPSSSAASASEDGDAVKTLSIAIPQNPNVEDFDTNMLTTWLEEDMNVNLEFTLLPATSEDANTKVSLWVSSNSDLPDVLCMSLSDTVAQDYASKGVLVDVTDYYADPEISVNISSSRFDGERDIIMNSIRFADGKYYSLFSYNPFPWNEAAYRTWVNQEWLDQLNMEAPTTTEEFRAMLEAFKSNDLNGNGKSDEIPMMSAKEGYGIDPTTFLMNAFIQTTPGADYMVVENGKLSPAFTTDEWKAGLEYIYGLVQDGLLSPLSFTQDSTQLKTLLTAEEAVVGVTCAGSTSMFGSDPAVVGRMALLEPLTGPNGVCGVSYQPSTAGRIWYITKDAEDPELAFRCGDWFFGEEQSWTARYGEKDVHWTDDPEITQDYLPMFEQYTPVKYVGTIYGSTDIWGQPQNEHWQGAHPYSTPLSEALYQSFAYKDDPDLDSKTNYNTTHLDIYYDKIPDEYVTKFLHDEEELDKLADYADMMDYVTSSMAEFITGNRSLDDWDNYLKTLDEMGLDEYVALRQSGFDRANAE
ncbi:MAG TPA: extracellular solute-binding protein [Candidatus Merdivicinus faecavium]|nr:extracellular solute-binding protein [Candidatus Merdivicinus faecavium]